MKKNNSIKVFVLLFASLSGRAFAQMTPIGLWKTVDEKTKQPESYVRISAQDGVLTGKLEKLLDPARQDAKCDKCSDDRKGKPMLNMTMMHNVKPADGVIWEGGDILDPNNGKVYRVRIKPLDGGKTLEVRGFIGPFYRNQLWTRVE